ncbi:MFS transporter [Streptomyces mayteni]
MRSSSSSPRLLNRVPWASSYPAAVALALLALTPFLVLTTATSLMRQPLLEQLGATPFELQLAVGLSNAGYAFGAVAAADLILRVPRRWVYFVCEGGFVVAAALALIAPGIGLFAPALIMLGVFTGVLLVVALPPLITRHGVDRLPTTAAVISLGLFGMVTIGPLLGGLIGSYGGWRLLFVGVTALAAIGLTIGVLTFEHNEPLRPGARFDWYAIPPALLATALPFFGVAWLTRGEFASVWFWLPLTIGVLTGVVLVGGQYWRKEPLMPVRPISDTLPVTGIAAAMVAGATFTTLIELTEAYLLAVPRYSPIRVGGLLTAQVVGIAVAALLVRRLLRTRWLPVMALSGLLSVAVGAVLLLTVSPGNASAVVPAAAVFLGFGAGAGVTPALFLAGLSVPAPAIGSIFALVELLRSEAAFLVGPVLLHLALDKGIEDGFKFATAITLAITLAGAALLVTLFALGTDRLHPPDLDTWVTGKQGAYRSPPLLARLRKS